MQHRTRIAVVAAAVVGVAAVGGGVAWASAGGDDGADEQLTGEELDRASEAALEHAGGGRVTGTEKDDEESAYEVEVTLDDGGQLDVQLDADYRVVGDERDERDDETDDADDAADGSDEPLTGEELDRASEAALAHAGGGQVTDSETGEDGYDYQVEVTLDDGTEVDVHLDDAFQVVGEERDAPGADD